MARAVKYHVFTTNLQKPPRFLNQQEREEFVHAQHVAKTADRVDLFVFNGFGPGKLQHYVTSQMTTERILNLLLESYEKGMQEGFREAKEDR